MPRHGGVGIWVAVGLGALALIAVALVLVGGDAPRMVPATGPAMAVPSDEAGLRALAKDPAVRAAGREVYASLCWNCHGRAGEGGIGPNLRDDWWIGGSDMQDLVDVIRKGRPGTAMQPMAQHYSPTQIAAVAAYVVSLRGTTGGNGKPPEGTLKPIEW